MAKLTASQVQAEPVFDKGSPTCRLSVRLKSWR